MAGLASGEDGPACHVQCSGEGGNADGNGDGDGGGSDSDGRVVSVFAPAVRAETTTGGFRTLGGK